MTKKLTKKQLFARINARQPIIRKGELDPVAHYVVHKAKKGDMECQDYVIINWHLDKIEKLAHTLPSGARGELVHHARAILHRVADRLQPTKGEVPPVLDLNKEKAPWEPS